MLIPKKNLSSDERKLIKLFSSLDAQRRSSLLAFAAFLAQEAATDSEMVVDQKEAPSFIERPEKESVVSAIKRLSASYFMLDSSSLLTEASTLMTAHVMRGRSAVEVIDDLEEMFAQHYKQYTADDDVDVSD